MIAASPRIHAYVSGPYIILLNNYSEPYMLKAVEVEYEISAGSVEPELPYEKESVVSPVRRITERINIGVSLSPGESYKLYFGATGRIRSITAVITIGDKDYRVVQEIRRKEAEE